MKQKGNSNPQVEKVVDLDMELEIIESYEKMSKAKINQKIDNLLPPKKKILSKKQQIGKKR